MAAETLRASEITPESAYLRRREFLRNAMLFGVTSSAVGGGLLGLIGAGRGRKPAADDDGAALPVIAIRSRYAAADAPTSFADITSYNNFYEFGTDKADPAAGAHELRTRPWTLRVEGEVHKPQTVDIDQLVRWIPLEERTYRMRCVEGWSMVIPWLGVPLGELLERAEPTSRARYVAFTSLHDPE